MSDPKFAPAAHQERTEPLCEQWRKLADEIDHETQKPGGLAEEIRASRDAKARTLRECADLLAVGAPARAAEWHPLETAPKDGTEILVCGCNGSRRVLSAFWLTDFFEGDTAIEAGWYHNGTMKLATPTHWMPLPLPPPGALAGDSNSKT